MADKQQKQPKTPLQLTLIRKALRLISRLSPALAGRWVNYLWYRTHRTKAPKREQQLLDEAEWQTVDYQGIPVQCYSWGTGPRVLLVHGWNGSAAQMTPVAKVLVEQGFRAIAFDAPAHGRSPGTRTELPAISAVIRLLEQELGPFNAAVTHSFGGMCLLPAIYEGVTVERVACIAPPLDVRTLLDQFSLILQLPDETLTVQKSLLEKRFGRNVWSTFSMPRWVENLQIPGLIIHDLDDNYVSCENGRQIADSWPRSELVLTSGLGHRRILRNALTLERLSRFLAPVKN